LKPRPNTHCLSTVEGSEQAKGEYPWQKSESRSITITTTTEPRKSKQVCRNFGRYERNCQFWMIYQSLSGKTVLEWWPGRRPAIA
jgi:hypothetical protein